MSLTMSTRTTTIAPINHIEIVEEYGEKVAYVAGTRLTVAEIGNMHVNHPVPIGRQ